MAYCKHCGAQVAEPATFCGACGTPVAGVAAGAATVAAGMTSNVAACLSYVLGFITGILFLVLDPYKNDRFVRFHSFQSIFFSAAVIGFSVLWSILSMILGFVSMGFLAWTMLAISLLVHMGFFCIWIIFMFKAYQNELFKAPVIGELAAKQAGL
jgi:uncharacterized membrane protein